MVVELNEGNADFHYNLDRPGFGVYPAADDGSLDWESGNGTGGYILKKFEPGVRAYLEQKGSHTKHGNQRRVNDVMEVPQLKLAASSVF